MAQPTRWIAVPAPRPGARLRLYCFPYAGGGAAVYRSWPEHLDRRIEVRTIVLPGRERRFTEPAIPSVEAVADLLVPALLPALDPPFAIFGHSLGALLGFEVACRLAAAGLPPVHLLASAARGPQLAASGPAYHLMEDAQLLESILDLGGVEPELATHRELLDLMLPVLRADFTAAETYRHEPVSLPCPITAFHGSEDEFVTRAEVEGWSAHTRGGFRLHELPGGHFFIATTRAELVGLVDRELTSHVCAAYT